MTNKKTEILSSSAQTFVDTCPNLSVSNKINRFKILGLIGYRGLVSEEQDELIFLICTKNLTEQSISKDFGKYLIRTYSELSKDIDFDLLVYKYGRHTEIQRVQEKNETDNFEKTKDQCQSLIDKSNNLEGTNKQLAWAKNIRSELIYIILKDQSLQFSGGKLEGISKILKNKSASWWIDNRRYYESESGKFKLSTDLSSALGLKQD